MRVATWNVNSLRVRLPHLQRWAEEARPDVVLLQETKVEDDKFPVLELQALGFEHLAFWGEPTYNGVAILSRHPIEAVQKGFSGHPEEGQPRLICGTVRGVRVLSAYVPMGERPGSEKFSYKLAFYSQLKSELRVQLAEWDQLLLTGDMNVAREDNDTWDPFEADGKILFHPTERQALERVIETGLVDTWRQKNPWANEFSWWDYRMRGFQLNHGFRIDYCFASKALAQKVVHAAMWKQTRGWEQPTKPSDHIPVSVDLELE